MPFALPSSDPHPLAAGLYTTDAFHRSTLFSIDGLVVRSWNEAHALHGPAQLEDVNPAYIAALIIKRNDAQVSPYRRIRRLPRAHYVRVGFDGTTQSHAYDPLAGGASAMESKAHINSCVKDLATICRSSSRAILMESAVNTAADLIPTPWLGRWCMD